MNFQKIITDCATCGGLIPNIKPARGPAKKYCTKQCKAIGQGVKRDKRSGSCVFCGGGFIGNASRTRCEKCQRKNRKMHESCGHCGKSFVGRSSGQTYCSVTCSKAARPLLSPLEKKERLQEAWRRKNHVRRARLRSAKVEMFHASEIFERDGYECQRCGIKTNPKLKDHNHNNYPTIDHIVPLSKGGEHSRANTQCLCRKCNMGKRNLIGGDQLRLIA